MHSRTQSLRADVARPDYLVSVYILVRIWIHPYIRVCAASYGGRQQHHMPAVLRSQAQARCGMAFAVSLFDVGVECKSRCGNEHRALPIISHCSMCMGSVQYMYPSTWTQATRPSACRASCAPEHLTFAACNPPLHPLLRLPLHRSPIFVLAFAGQWSQAFAGARHSRSSPLMRWIHVHAMSEQCTVPHLLQQQLTGEVKLMIVVTVSNEWW